MQKKIVVSLPKPTHLKNVESYASRRYGGQWKACEGFRDCWPDEENKDNFCWILEREVEK